jgi:hypothetical protein
LPKTTPATKPDATNKDKTVPTEKNTTEVTKNKEIWKPTKPRKPTIINEPDRSCWLYIYNNTTRDIQNRRYQGDRE